MANFSIFGERVPRLCKPPPIQRLPEPSKKLAIGINIFKNNAILKPINGTPEPNLIQNDKPKKRIVVVKRKVRVKKVKTEEVPYRPKVIPNLPDKILWYIFDLLDYKNQCKAEGVCRRWQKMIRNKQRREIKDLSVEMLGSKIEILQQKAFQRLSITCPRDAFDFLSGVMRRSHTLLNSLTCDFGLLANAAELSFETEGRWKYFSGVEQLWLLVTRCPTEMLTSFCKIEGDLFTELTNLTIQIHTEEDLENMGELVKILIARHKNSEIDLELHANSSKKILNQLEYLDNLQLNRLKVVCSALDAAPLALNLLVDAFQKSQIRFKKIVFLEWYLNFDQETPIVTHPVQLLHINSCSINRSQKFVSSLYQTMNQKRKKPKPNSTLTPKQLEDKENNNLQVEKTPAKKPATKKVVRKKVQYIKKMEMAGSINCSDLMFLASRQHLELEEQIQRKIPNLIVDSSEIYYFE